MAEKLGFEDWARIHHQIFVTHGFPVEKLGKSLYEKLCVHEIQKPLDFVIENRPHPTLMYRPKGRKTKLEPFSNVFVTEHFWSAEPNQFVKDYKANVELRKRVDPFCTDDKDKSSISLERRMLDCDGRRLDLSCCIFDIEDLEIAKRFPQLEVINISGTEISLEQVKAHLSPLSSSLRGISFDEDELDGKRLLEVFPKVEVINDKFTDKWTVWALMFACNNEKIENVVHLDLKGRNIALLKGEEFKKFVNLLSIDLRGNPCNITDIKKFIPSLTSIWCDEGGIPDDDFIFINGVDKETGDVSYKIHDNIWRHMQCTGADWGLCDEIGLAIHHNLECNFASMPAGSPYFGKTYFVFWPIKEISTGNEVTSNLFPLIPFIDPSSVDPRPEKQPMKSLKSAFKSTVARKNPVRVFIEYPPFVEGLHSDKFIVVDNPNEADLLWITKTQQTDFSSIYSTGKFFNQIEGENFLTAKDLLYITCTSFMRDVSWYPETFILNDSNDIYRFLKRHNELKNKGESCVFMVKAFNLTRAVNMVVSDSASEILKHASGEFRLAQRYIWNPLNIFGSKFDLRFIVLLKSVKPFELFVYKTFWPRISPKKWALEDLSDYERHFTVMNYVSPDKVTHKTYIDFIQQFKIENPETTWATVLDRIYLTIRDLFICGAQKMVQSPYTKSMYGIDLMITKEYQPIVLECNFQPDCRRACDLCPTFVDDVFEVLFIDQPVTNEKVHKIELD